MTENRDVWSELKNGYSVEKTPKSLLGAIASNIPSGKWSKYGFAIKYTAKKEHNVIVVSTEDVARSGGCCGATCYINAENPNQCVWDK